MSDVHPNLSQRDRVELLCWLTIGNLGAYYLNETWPAAGFQVQAAHKWLDRHLREADWLTLAKLAAIALDIAHKHTDDLNLDARLVALVLDDCQAALADRRGAD